MKYFRYRRASSTAVDRLNARLYRGSPYLTWDPTSTNLRFCCKEDKFSDSLIKREKYFAPYCTALRGNGVSKLGTACFLKHHVTPFSSLDVQVASWDCPLSVAMECLESSLPLRYAWNWGHIRAVVLPTMFERTGYCWKKKKPYHFSLATTWDTSTTIVSNWHRNRFAVV